MLRRQNLWAFGLDFSVSDPHLVHAVHQLRDQIKIETGAAERGDLTLRRKNHARIFKRVVKIVAGHDRYQNSVSVASVEKGRGTALSRKLSGIGAARQPYHKCQFALSVLRFR